MEKNLITEIHRISELIGVKNKITLNEGVLGPLFKNVVESELIAILKAEIKAAMKQGVEVVSQRGTLSTTVKDAAEAAVKTKSGLKSLSASQKSGLKAELIRLGKEEAEAAAKKGTQKASKEAAEKGINISIVNTVENNSKQVVKGTTKKTAGGGTKRLTATAEDLAVANNKGLKKVVQIGGVDYVMELAKKGWSFKRIIKSSAVKWGLGLLAAGLIVWWILATMGDTVPEDTPPIPPKPEDTDNDGGDGGNDGGIYTTPGDPYQYKVVDCVWFTKSLEQRGKIISDWTSLANNQKAIGILDGRFPDARKNCGGNTPTPTPTTNNDTLTPSGTTLNQQYGTEPMANAQAEVQTTNDDINNY
jgi:hypothetical protein